MTEKRPNIFLRSVSQSPWTIFTVAVRALGTLSVIKIISVYFGSAGLALFSHFQNLIGLVTQIPEQGTNLGVIRHYSQFSEDRKRVLIGTSFMINLLLFVLISIILVFRKDFFLRYFDTFQSTPLYMWGLLLAVFFVLLNSLAFSFLYARQSFRLLFGITIANILLIIFSTYYGSISGEVQGAMLGFAAGWGIYSVMNFVFLTVRGDLPRLKFSFDRPMNRILLRFIGIAVVGVVMGKWVDYFVRDFALNWFGSEITGHWQAQVRMSESYRSVFLGTLGVIFFSQISRMNAGGKEWTLYIRKMLGLAMVVSASGLLLLYLLREPVILLLFQSELLPAGEFLYYQLLSDLFALPSFLMVFLLVVTEKWNLYISLHILSALVYLLGIVVFTGLTDLGIAGIPAANLVRYVFFFLALLVMMRKNLVGK